MTTGRINQVTILAERVSRSDRRRRSPEGSESLPRKGHGRNRCPAHGWARAQGSERPRAIQLPPLSSPRDGPPQEQRRAREGLLLPATYVSREEIPGHPSRPERRLRDTVDPRMSLRLMMAIGQPSADSSNARRKEPAGLRSLDVTRSLLSREGQLGCSLRSNVDRRPDQSCRWPQRFVQVLGPRLAIGRLRDKGPHQAPERADEVFQRAIGPTDQGLKRTTRGGGATH